MGSELCSSLLQLFELLGFDRFEFIQLLLENRPTLVKNISLEATREAILQAPSKAAQFGFCAFSCQRLLKKFFVSLFFHSPAVSLGHILCAGLGCLIDNWALQ